MSRIAELKCNHLGWRKNKTSPCGERFLRPCMRAFWFVLHAIRFWWLNTHRRNVLDTFKTSEQRVRFADSGEGTWWWTDDFKEDRSVELSFLLFVVIGLFFRIKQEKLSHAHLVTLCFESFSFSLSLPSFLTISKILRVQRGTPPIYRIYLTHLSKG